MSARCCQMYRGWHAKDCSTAPAELDAGGVSEGLSEAERKALSRLVYPAQYDDPSVVEIVDFIEDLLAARDAATADRARREGAVEAGERIAQAIEALRPDVSPALDGERDPAEAIRLRYALNRAASIARSTP